MLCVFYAVTLFVSCFIFHANIISIKHRCVCVCACVSLVNQALLKKIQRKRRKRGRPGSRSYVCAQPHTVDMYVSSRTYVMDCVVT